MFVLLVVCFVVSKPNDAFHPTGTGTAFLGRRLLAADNADDATEAPAVQPKPEVSSSSAERNTQNQDVGQPRSKEISEAEIAATVAEPEGKENKLSEKTTKSNPEDESSLPREASEIENVTPPLIIKEPTEGADGVTKQPISDSESSSGQPEATEVDDKPKEFKPLQETPKVETKPEEAEPKIDTKPKPSGGKGNVTVSEEKASKPKATQNDTQDRNATKSQTTAAPSKVQNETTPAELDCVTPAYHEFPPDLFSHKARARGGVVVHILVVLYMFYALAVVCDDYFVASLEECCSRLSLSEDVAGATFMAAGSSAPELFTAILGVLIAKGDVGTGTIVGSAVFNVLFVIGLCGLCSGKDVPVTWWPLFRDSFFYAFTVVILIIVIYDGDVSWYESLIMLLLYGVYILLMKYNVAIHRWVGGTFGIHEDDQSTTLGLTAAAYDAKNYSSYVPFNNEIDDFAQQNTTTRAVRPLDELIRDSRRRPTLYEAALMMLMTRPFRPKTRFWAAAKRVTHEHKRIRRGEIQHLPSQSSLDPNDLVRRRKSTSVDITLSTEADWRRVPRLRDGPISVVKWCIQAPLLATLHYTVPDCKTAVGKRLFMLSFFMSIFWTAIFSYVMVWMVTLIGFTMGIPDTIMGITFLAAGTSIPDAFASLLVSRQGQGDMAIANSIGSNVFDILIGLALPWLIQTGMVEPGSLATINSGGLVWSVVLLFLTIIITIYAIHRSHWLLTKRLGIFLLVVYVFFLIFCSAVEFNLLGYVNPPMCSE